jgi:DNA-binding transcriptional MerR regulator
VLTIGEFARMTHLSVRTLRRYHEAGLLEPAHVHPSSGYRYYDAAQIPDAQVIFRLRELDVPLANVRQILLTQDLARTQAAVAALQRLLRPEPAGVAVELRQVSPQLVAAVEATVAHADVLAWYAGAMAELDAVVREPAGPAGGLYANALFSHGRGNVLVHVPIAAPVPAVGRVRSTELPSAELAVAVHDGAHDTIDVTYGELGRWVADHALAVAGPVRETYLVGPRDTPVAAHWRTEIGWPVFRVTGAV